MRVRPSGILVLGLLLGCRAHPAAGRGGELPRARAAHAAPGTEASEISEGSARSSSGHGEAPSVAPDSPAGALPELDLARALELARRSHPSLAAARARVAAAVARGEQAGRLPNPDAHLRVESAALEGAPFESAEILAGISQPLPLGRRRSAAERVARTELARAELELEAVDLEVGSRVRGAFATTLYAQRAVELRDELLGQSLQLVGLLEARHARGDIARAEILLVELASLEARHELERADSLLVAARAELALVLGLPGHRIGALAGELEPAFALPAIEELLARIEDNPLLLSAGAALEADQARVELAAAERIPDLRLDLFYRRIEAGDRDAFDLGVSLPVPLFQGARPRIDEARARVAESRARERSEHQRLESAARVAHGRLSHARLDLERIDREVLPRVERLLEIQERRFAAGDLPLALLLEARSRASEAHLARLEALRAALAAWADLAPFLLAPGNDLDASKTGAPGGGAGE